MKKMLTAFALAFALAGSGSALADEPTTIAGHPLAHYESLLADTARVVRLRAVRTIGAFGESAGPALAAALEHDDAAVRYIAAVHLGRMGGKPLEDSVNQLVKLRNDESSLSVQQAAAFALCRAGKLDGNLSLLVERLSYPERAMACSAAELIGMVGPPAASAAKALEQIRRDNPPTGKGDYHLGGAAGHALAKITSGAT